MGIVGMSEFEEEEKRWNDAEAWSLRGEEVEVCMWDLSAECERTIVGKWRRRN